MPVLVNVQPRSIKAMNILIDIKGEILNMLQRNVLDSVLKMAKPKCSTMGIVSD